MKYERDATEMKGKRSCVYYGYLVGIRIWNDRQLVTYLTFSVQIEPASTEIDEKRKSQRHLPQNYLYTSQYEYATYIYVLLATAFS